MARIDLYRKATFASQLITNTATVYANPNDEIDGEFEGTILFTATATNATGTFDVDVTLQGSIDNVTFVSIETPVALVDTVKGAASLTGSLIKYAYYRLKITGADTQTTNVIAQYLAKGRG